ncbi:N1R/p28-like protein [Adoxophyes honmai entomopoxvirus 'L']|uniref:N1R/p28-like protein n=1 Tax=Adoxophyes honmai entomopoxvirus 'L' TaxID=1293540 RepID=A0A916KP07_9POXV|nr:N1R/p28-like protein [Adoxophyes honmai entomopoxvirus 'L']CCU55442.1 N1R/p28-like protein [Adoxophyes honmai entomopoxvirus 'L']
MNSIKYNDINIKIENNKYNVKDIFICLDYNNYEEHFGNNEDRYYSLKLIKKIFKDNEKEKNLVKYLEVNVLMDIFTFIDYNNYDLKLGKWFTDIWYPLYEKRDILITNNLLLYVFNGISVGGLSPPLDYRNIKKKFKDILNHHNIEYKIINYEQIITNFKYYIDNIKNDIISIKPNNLSKSVWFILSVRNFKSLIMRLNTKIAQEIREYYISLEEILYDYSKYINEYNIIKIKNVKNKEIEEHKMELIKANKKALMINKFMNNTVIKSNKLEWIYIASTDQYQQDKLYKIGSTERLHKRIKYYQTGRPDEYYYIWVKPCYNSKDLDYNIQNLLKDFKYKTNKELYHGIFIDDLVNIVEFIINNYDKTLEYIYDFIKNKLQNSIIKDPIIKKPLDIKSISYNIGNYTETINIEEENNNLIRQELFNFLETIEDKCIIKRSDLLNKLKINMNKIDMWKELKNTLNWKTGKDLLKYNNKEFYLCY